MKKRIISVVMKKRIISLLSALALTAQIVPCALADNDVKVYVNDTEMITDAPIIIENNRTLVPVRAILEYLDYVTCLRSVNHISVTYIDTNVVNVSALTEEYKVTRL